MIQLETDRLLLRPFRESDLDDYARMCGDPEVMRYIGGGKTLNRSESWRSIAMILGHWQLRGYGLWAVEEKASKTLIGRVGLFNPEGWPGLEVGWLIDKSRWGCGFAPEGGQAALDCAFSTLGADHVISVIEPGNAASIRVAEKIGARFERRAQLNGTEVLVYGIRRANSFEC